MPLTLPNLDDRTWEQLTAEARALLPSYAPAWTNYNPSDPGVTLIELLASFTEQMLYRTNRLGDEHTLLFLRLLQGQSWSPTASLEAEKRLALQGLETPVRAVTAADFEALAVAAALAAGSHPPNAVPRAVCLPNRDLREPGSPEDTAAIGHVSVILLPAVGRDSSPSLLRRVKHALDTARLITTHVHVVAPRFLTFGIRFTLVLDDRVTLESVRNAAMNRLQDFFDPHHGGLNGKGWPFGRSVYLSDLYRLLGAIDGVDHVTRTVDETTGKTLNELNTARKEARRLVTNERGELIALTVNEGELVSLEFTARDIILKRKGARP